MRIRAKTTIIIFLIMVIQSLNVKKQIEFYQDSITIDDSSIVPHHSKIIHSTNDIMSDFPKSNHTISNDYTQHSVITIRSDADFATQKMAEGWSGNGSVNNPYVIQGYNITRGSTNIHIVNVNAHFEIRNCLLISPAYGYFSSGDGILIENSSNGVILNNTFLGGRDTGLYVLHSNITAKGNYFNRFNRRSFCGIIYYESSGFITNNRIVNFEQDGIYIVNSSHIAIISNEIVGGRSGITILRSNHISISNNELCEQSNDRYTNDFASIILYSSVGCSLQYNNIHQNEIGVRLESSNSCIIHTNMVQHNLWGIQLLNSIDCLIVGNLVYNNTEIGIELNNYSTNNRIYENKIGLNGQNAVCDGPHNYWDDSESCGNSWSDLYNTSLYSIPGEGQCIDRYPSQWLITDGSEESFYPLLGTIGLVSLGFIMIIARWKFVSKRDKDYIIVPRRYRLVSWFHRRKPIKQADADDNVEQDSLDQ